MAAFPAAGLSLVNVAIRAPGTAGRCRWCGFWHRTVFGSVRNRFTGVVSAVTPAFHRPAPLLTEPSAPAGNFHRFPPSAVGTAATLRIGRMEAGDCHGPGTTAHYTKASTHHFLRAPPHALAVVATVRRMAVGRLARIGPGTVPEQAGRLATKSAG